MSTPIAQYTIVSEDYLNDLTEKVRLIRLKN